MTVFGFACIAAVVFAVMWRLGLDRISDMKAARDRAVAREEETKSALILAISQSREARVGRILEQMHSGKLSRIIHSQRVTIGRLKERLTTGAVIEPVRAIPKSAKGTE